MKKAFAMKWADALESGDYKQTKGKLFNGKGYCCLGVACVLAKKKFEYDKEYKVWSIDEMPTNELLPDDVASKIGMYGAEGELRDLADLEIGKKYYSSLADANDRGVKFKIIAQFIRDNYKQL